MTGGVRDSDSIPLTKEELEDIQEEDLEATSFEASSKGWVCPDCGNANLADVGKCDDCGTHRCCE